MNLVPLRPHPVAQRAAMGRHEARPAAEHVGELWLAGPASRRRGSTAGGGARSTSSRQRHGEALVGSAGMARYGARFPLLAKLIDAADWLSLQVHPDDALAREMYGPAAVGKAEAWVMLDADHGAELVTGPADDLAHADLLVAIAAGEAGYGHCRRTTVRPGDTLIAAAGDAPRDRARAPLSTSSSSRPTSRSVSRTGGGRVASCTSPSRRGRSLPRAACRAGGPGFRLDGGRLTTQTFRLEFRPRAGGTRARRAHARGGDGARGARCASRALAGSFAWSSAGRSWSPPRSRPTSCSPTTRAIAAIGSLP